MSERTLVSVFTIYVTGRYQMIADKLHINCVLREGYILGFLAYVIYQHD